MLGNKWFYQRQQGIKSKKDQGIMGTCTPLGGAQQWHMLRRMPQWYVCTHCFFFHYYPGNEWNTHAEHGWSLILLATERERER